MNQYLQVYGILHNAAATVTVDGECMNIHTYERKHKDSVHPVCTSKMRLCVEGAHLQTCLLKIAGFLNCLIFARGAQNVPEAKFCLQKLCRRLEDNVSPCIIPSPRRTTQSETIWFFTSPWRGCSPRYYFRALLSFSANKL